MRLNPLFLGSTRAAFARNIAFDEASIETRPGIRYTKLGIKGTYQGGNFFTPSEGLSAMSYASTPSGIVSVVDGQVYINPVMDDEVSSSPHKLGEISTYTDPVYTYDAENYQYVLGKKTYWSNGGEKLKCSQGIGECDETDSHDTFIDENHKHWLPHDATIGAYVHGRNHIAVDYSCNSTEIMVSDIIGKRGCAVSNDLNKMEEQMNPSYGGGLSGPSKFGRTLALEVLLDNQNNGEGELYDFRQNGILRHNTLFSQRQARYDAEGKQLTKGWDTQRLTNVATQKISAVGRYAVTQMPNDLFFRSKYGFHFLKSVLGNGSFNDETTNTISHDVDPLLDCDTENREGTAVGHWLECSRFFGTIKHEESDTSATPLSRHFISWNQASTYTEDRTPRMIAEGVWSLDSKMAGIHRFMDLGCKFGFIASDIHGELYFGEFDKSLKGLDKRNNKSYNIEWELHTGSHPLGGIQNIAEVTNGYLDAIVNETSQNLKTEVRTDANLCWEDWSKIDCSTSGLMLLQGYELSRPPKNLRSATWFQFGLSGEGFVDIRTLDVDYRKDQLKSEGKGKCIPMCEEKENYFNV